MRRRTILQGSLAAAASALAATVLVLVWNAAIYLDSSALTAGTSIQDAAGNDATRTLATPGAASYTDTAASDTFTATTGTLSGADRDAGTTLTYGISGVTATSGTATQVGTYGTLVVNTSSGAYTFTPNATVSETRSAMAPTANSKESPGRNGVTTRPVSAKMIRNSRA